MVFRLSLSVNPSATGWCLLGTAKGVPVSLIDAGVRVYTDGRDSKSRDPLAAARRQARQARRMRDRRLQRQKSLLRALIESGLLPTDDAERKDLSRVNPYEIRAAALDSAVPLAHIGRALLHINHR